MTEIKNLTDDKIIELYFNRDEAAIKMTEQKYGKYILTVANHYLHDENDCLECRNDTYLAVWNAIPPKHPKSFKAFVTKLAMRISIDKYKEKTRQKRIPSDFTVSIDELSETLGDTYTVESHADQIEIRRILNKFIESLPKKSRFIFVCRYFCSDPASKIARSLGISESSVVKELAKLRAELKKILEEEDLDV